MKTTQRLDHRVLCYVRPWSSDYFEYVCGEVFDQKKTFYVSDFRRFDTSGLAERFYQEYRRKNHASLPAPLDEESFHQVSVRCRLLRRLPENEVRRLVISMTIAIEAALDKIRPDAIYSITVDSYVLHLLKYCAEKRGIPFYGMCTIVINGYHLITALGEHNNFRTPSDEECERVTQTLLSKNYSTVYLSPKATHPATIARRWSREVAKAMYFSARRRATRDPLNYHYWSTSTLTQDRSGVSFLFPHRFFDDNWEKKLKSDLPQLYLPIQFHPECNSEYWPKEPFIEYEPALIEVVKRLPDDLQLLVKEHPNMLGYRSPGFYQKLLSAHKNVVFIPPQVPSESLIQRADAVLTWSGSVGIEAPLRGKPVITFGAPYYQLEGIHEDIQSLEKVGQVHSRLSALQGRGPIDHDKKKALIRHVLSGCNYGDSQEIYFSSANPTRLDNAQTVIRSLQENFDHWHRWSTRANRV